MFFEVLYSFMLKSVNHFGFTFVYDVRFMPNPFYEAELREHTGLETCIRDYVMNSDVSHEFLAKLSDMVKFLIPLYIGEETRI